MGSGSHLLDRVASLGRCSPCACRKHHENRRETQHHSVRQGTKLVSRAVEGLLSTKLVARFFWSMAYKKITRGKNVLTFEEEAILRNRLHTVKRSVLGS